MGKLLRVLIVVILVLGAVALFLAIVNYSKREVLVGRTRTLERALTRLSATIEQVDAQVDVQPRYPSRDISSVTSRVIENPDLSPFWDNYETRLERHGQPTFNLGTEDKQLQMRQFYQLDAEGKRVPDRLGRGYATSGPGTMQELLDEVIDRATVQYNTLSRTRTQLERVREELVSTIEELNREKRTRRQNLRRIEELESQVAQLERDKRGLEQRIERLEGEKRELQAEIAEAREEIRAKEEDLDNQRAEIKRLEDEIERLRRPEGPVIDRPGVPADIEQRLSPGDKGRILSTDSAWSFAIIELSDEFLDELLGPEREQPLAQIDMMVRRPGFSGPADEFVTKVRLRQRVSGHNVVIADLLPAWQQTKPIPGDIVFF